MTRNPKDPFFLEAWKRSLRVELIQTMYALRYDAASKESIVLPVKSLLLNSHVRSSLFVRRMRERRIDIQARSSTVYQAARLKSISANSTETEKKDC